ncbi:MAG TPA: hypothetical protein VF290_02635 [Pyrinomonadaceae bacterium]
MSVLIPDAAVQAIKDSEQTQIITIGDTEFTSRIVYEPPRDPVPATLKLNTLTGIVEYINNGADGVKEDEIGLMVHVVNERQVDVLSGTFGRFDQRAVYASSSADAVLSKTDFQFGQFYECEAFVIKLLSLFEDFEGRTAVLKIVGNIKEENVRQASDDGVTQTVTARSGIARVEEVSVPNPVYLAPYRTFREVTQPLSPFVLRMKQGREGGLPTVALFEADGGKWKLDAIAFIRDYLREKIETVPIIA